MEIAASSGQLAGSSAEVAGAAAERAGISPALIKSLSKRSTWRALAAVALQWAIIVGCAVLAQRSGSYLAAFLAIVVIATRQHALLVLMHDAAHYSLSNSKGLNDFVARLFLAFPFSVSMKRYRVNHLAHHQHVNEAVDPDLEDNIAPQTVPELAKLVISDLFFLAVPKALRRSRKFGVLGIFRESGEGWWTERTTYLVFALAVAVAAAYFDLWGMLFFYWLVPMFSFLQVILRLRGYSEHAGRMTEQTEVGKSRTIDVGPVERFLFAPYNVNRHLEHHLYPSIPFFNLERAHVELTTRPGVFDTFKPSEGYFGAAVSPRTVFGELYRHA